MKQRCDADYTTPNPANPAARERANHDAKQRSGGRCDISNPKFHRARLRWTGQLLELTAAISDGACDSTRCAVLCF